MLSHGDAARTTNAACRLTPRSQGGRILEAWRSPAFHLPASRISRQRRSSSTFRRSGITSPSILRIYQCLTGIAWSLPNASLRIDGAKSRRARGRNPRRTPCPAPHRPLNVAARSFVGGRTRDFRGRVSIPEQAHWPRCRLRNAGQYRFRQTRDNPFQFPTFAHMVGEGCPP